MDGTLAGSDSAFSLDFDSASPVKWGGSAHSFDRWFNGSLADLAIFDAPLTPADITKLNAMPVMHLNSQTGSNTVTRDPHRHRQHPANQSHSARGA